MATAETTQSPGNADFLFSSRDARQIFTREDLSGAQQMVNKIAADFMRTEVLPVIRHSAKQAASAIANDDDYYFLLSQIHMLSNSDTFHVVTARRRIADAVINAGRYYL